MEKTMKQSKKEITEDLWIAAEEEGRGFEEIERRGRAKVALAVGLFVSLFAFGGGCLLSRLL